jgi:DNA gyrase subunit A
VDLPVQPGASVNFATSSKANDYVIGLAPKETILTIVPLGDVPVAIGTRNGVVKRVDPTTYPQRGEFSIINLDGDDVIVGAALSPDDHELVFVTHATQLLHFPASGVRAQGVGAAGMAGIKLGEGDVVVHFASVPSSEDTRVVTVTTAGATLTGADPGRAKVSALSEFPGKGRATGGVRAHTLLKGEIGLAAAFVGDEPRASANDGTARELPTELGKRDGSGSPLADVIGAIGTRLR